MNGRPDKMSSKFDMADTHLDYNVKLFLFLRQTLGINQETRVTNNS